MSVQFAGQRNLDRKEHIWTDHADGGFVCVLCGRLIQRDPRRHPDAEVCPEKYLKLTAELRAMAPYTGTF